MSVVLHEDQICSLLHMHLMYRQITLIWVSVSLNHQLKIADSHVVNLITNMSVDLVDCTHGTPCSGAEVCSLLAPDLVAYAGAIAACHHGRPGSRSLESWLIFNVYEHNFCQCCPVFSGLFIILPSYQSV